MEQKYWVPAIKKANAILQLIAEEPYRLKLIDLSKRLQIHKSSMFSLLHTMETLGWVARDKGDTYVLGTIFGHWGSAYFSQYDIIRSFHLNAPKSRDAVGETFQLARLDGQEVLYLAKVEAISPIRLASEPGMKYPAHATALGKAMLAQLPPDELKVRYVNPSLRSLTPNTMTRVDDLFRQLQQIKELGFALDLEESVMGFCCVAASVTIGPNQELAAVSCSMPVHQWELKKDIAAQETVRLAAILSFGNKARIVP